jgi:hypothetical protein
MPRRAHIQRVQLDPRKGWEDGLGWFQSDPSPKHSKPYPPWPSWVAFTHASWLPSDILEHDTEQIGDLLPKLGRLAPIDGADAPS